MWHRGTPNPTDEPRTMLTGGYFRKDFYFEYGDPFHNLDENLYKELDPSVQALFTPYPDVTDWRYWKLRQRRTVGGVTDRRYLGAPLRIGLRWAYRVTTRIHTYRADDAVHLVEKPLSAGGLVILFKRDLGVDCSMGAPPLQDCASL